MCKPTYITGGPHIVTYVGFNWGVTILEIGDYNILMGFDIEKEDFEWDFNHETYGDLMGS